MRMTISVLVLILHGCTTVQHPPREDINCSFWDKFPYDSSQEPWRNFDCPLTKDKK